MISKVGDHRRAGQWPQRFCRSAATHRHARWWLESFALAGWGGATVCGDIDVHA